MGTGVQAFADQLAGGNVPHAGHPVAAAGQQELAVPAEGEGDDCALMPEGFAEGLAPGHVPQPGGLVLAAGRKDLAIVAEDTDEDLLLVTGQTPLPGER